jgi:hypothetical protein
MRIKDGSQTDAALKSVPAWYFLTAEQTMPYGPKQVTEAGKTYSAAPEAVVIWKNAVHASRRVADALWLAKSSTLARVVLHEDIRDDLGYVTAARHCDVQWTFDADQVLNDFACFIAEQMLAAEKAAGREPDARTFAAVATKRKWLDGTATEAELRAASKELATYLGKDPSQKEYNPALHAEVKPERSAARCAAAASASTAGWASARNAFGSLQLAASVSKVPAIVELEAQAYDWLEKAILARELGPPSR